MAMEVLTERERLRRREHMRDLRSAIMNGQSLAEFQAAHDARVERWCALFHVEMEKAHTDDPLEVLPTLMAKIEESAIAAARAAAEKVARAEVERMLRRGFA
jgi:hypothetical protein